MGVDTGRGLQEMKITGLSCTRDLMQTSIIAHSIITGLEVFIHVLPHFIENQWVNLVIALGLTLVPVEKTRSKNYFSEEKNFQDYMCVL